MEISFFRKNARYNQYIGAIIDHEL